MSRHRQANLNSIDSINVTPLVDLTFLLLIVFMITAPVLEYAVDVQPPPLDAGTIGEQVSKVVSLDAEGQVFWEAEAISLDELAERTRAAVAATPDITIFIRADESRAYGEVVGIMRTIKKSGTDNVSLVTLSEND